MGKGLHIVGRDEITPLHGSPGFGGPVQPAGGTGTGPHLQLRMAPGQVRQRHDVVGHPVGDVDLTDLLLRLYQFLRIRYCPDLIEGNPISQLPEHLPLLSRTGIAHADADEESVHLSRRKAEGAFRFHRILGRQDDKGSRKGETLSVNGDLPLLHGFQQGRLGAGDRPVDLVRQQQVGHHWALAQFKVPFLLVVDPHADNIAGQHVGHKLDPPGLAAQCDGDGLHQSGFAHAGQIVQQNMAVGQYRHD